MTTGLRMQKSELDVVWVPMPREPLASPSEKGTHTNRKMWRTIAEAHGCVALLPNESLTNSRPPTS